MRRQSVAALLLCAFVGLARINAAQVPAPTATAARAVVSAAAPIFAQPDGRGEPLRIAKEGSVIRLLSRSGEWAKIEYQDPQYGIRTAYIQSRFLRIDERSSEPQDLSIPDTRPAVQPRPTEGTAASGPVTPALIFKGAQLRQQEKDKTTDATVTLRFEQAGLVIEAWNSTPKHPMVVKALGYGEITGAEYTFGKSPRVAAALLVSPLFLFNSSKSHWLNVKSAGDYTLLRLDKSNYKLVLSEIEKRSGVKVEDVGENK